VSGRERSFAREKYIKQIYNKNVMWLLMDGLDGWLAGIVLAGSGQR